MHCKCSIFSPFLFLYSTVSRLNMLCIFLLVLLLILFLCHLFCYYQNCMHEEITSILNLGNACYHSVENLLSSSLLSKNTVVSSVCETWSPILRVEQRVSMLRSRLSRKMFGPKRDEITGEWM